MGGSDSDNFTFESNQDQEQTNPTTEDLSFDIFDVKPQGSLNRDLSSAYLSLRTTKAAVCSYVFEGQSRVMTLSSDFKLHESLLSLTGNRDYSINIQCNSTKNSQISNNVVINFNTRAVDDLEPPMLSGLLPQGTLAANTMSATIQVVTNESSTCKYSSSPQPYSLMNSLFDSGNNLLHTKLISLTPDTDYLFYVACIDQNNNITNNLGMISFKTDKPTPVSGSDLYNTHCMNCHGAVNVSTKRGRTAAQIQSAIINIGAMNYLTSLTSQQVELIAQALEIVDSEAPRLSNPLPTGTLAGTTTSTVLRISTHEKASCRAHTSNVDFSQMTIMMNSDQGGFEHSASRVVIEDTNYNFYVRCQDESGNTSNVSTIIFRVDKKPAVDNIAPLISNLLPSGQFVSGTTQTILSINTNEIAECRYALDSNLNFSQMTLFSQTNASQHSSNVNGLRDGENYNYTVQCRDPAMNLSLKSAISFSIVSTNNGLDGLALYNTNCQTCHGAVNSSTVDQKNAVAIQSAIATQPQMQGISYLKQLGADQISAIAYALVNNQNTGVVTSELESKYSIGTRRAVASKFVETFVTSSTSSANQAVKNKIDERVTNEDKGIFGGACTDHSSNCPGNEVAQINAKMIPDATSARRSSLYITCQVILDIDQSVDNALSKAGLSINSSANSSNIDALFDHFYPGIPISSSIRSNLMSLYNNAINEGLSSRDAWRMVMDPMCKSPLFELF